jgi:hypothetical protein
MGFSLQRQALTGDAHAIGNQKLVRLLELAGEQTIKAVCETYFALTPPLSHIGGHAAPIP